MIFYINIYDILNLKLNDLLHFTALWLDNKMPTSWRSSLSLRGQRHALDQTLAFPDHRHCLRRSLQEHIQFGKNMLCRPISTWWTVTIPAFPRRLCHLKLRFAVHTSGLCELSSWRHVVWLDQQSPTASLDDILYVYFILLQDDLVCLTHSEDVQITWVSTTWGIKMCSGFSFEIWYILLAPNSDIYRYLTFTVSLQAIFVDLRLDEVKTVERQWVSESWCCYGSASRNLATNRSKSCKQHQVLLRFQKIQKLLLGVWILLTSLVKKQTVDLPRFAVW